MNINKKKAILFLTGGIGNQFYQYCALEKITEELNLNPIIDLNNFNNKWQYREVGIFKLLKAFNYEKEVNVSSKFYRPFIPKFHKKFPELTNLIFNSILNRKIITNKKDYEELFDNQRKYNLWITGYLQFHEMIADSKIGQHLKFNYLRKSTSHKIGVHIRLGDYLEKPFSHVYWKFNEYYLEESLKLIKKTYGENFIKKVFLFSDSLKIAKNIITRVLPKDVEIVYSEGNSVLDDLVALSECNIKILSNSTFSLLSYYLNSSEMTICPKKWYENVYETPRELFPPDFYNGRFIKLDN